MLTQIDVDKKRTAILEIAKEHGVVNIKLFAVSKNQITPNSDIDFLVEFEEGRSLFDLISMKEKLVELFGQSVHLVTKDSIHWKIRDQILREAIEI